MKILGLSFFYHDSSACLLIDGQPMALAGEERFSRQKNDSGFPKQAIDFVLRHGGVSADELDWVVFYEKPFIKFDRIIKTSLATFPFSPRVFAEGIKHLFLDKLWIRNLICSKLKISPDKILFSNHHLSHAASAFFGCPWDKAAILTIDGVGEWATTTLGLGENNTIKILKEIHFPNSLGLLYSAFTAFLGFEVNEGEYKVMGMAPYGKSKYADKVRKLFKIFPDGSFELNMKYFCFDRSLNKTYSKKFMELFGRPRDPKSRFFTRETGWPPYFGPVPQGDDYNRLAEEQEYYADVAASLQTVHEELLINLIKELYQITHLDKLCLAGGVALNSVANWKIIEKSPFKEIFIQPCAGDGGAALGAALAIYHLGLNQKEKYVMHHAYYGKSYTEMEIKKFLDEKNIKYNFINEESVLLDTVANDLVAGNVIGWFHGRFEWGPRALGSRSILADPRRSEMKDIINSKIKFREPYRPFAPSTMADHAEEIFEMPNAKNHQPARFMLYVVSVKKDKRKIVPAITHVDGTARPQLVYQEDSPRYWRLINAFYQKTGVPLVLNTSFNLRGEPIVNTPADAVSTFARSEMDTLVLENFIIERRDLPNNLINNLKTTPSNYKKSSKEKLANILKKIGLAILSIILTLAVLEIVLRITIKPIYPILSSDVDVGTIHQKNYRGLIWNDESESYNYVVTNGLGYLGEDYSLAKPANAIRVAVLGDSMTEGLQVDYYKNFAVILQEALNVSRICGDKKFEIMNYGVGGTGTFLQYQTYKKYVAPYKPDVVLLIFHGNDFADNLNKADFDLENYREDKRRNVPLKSILLKSQLVKYLFIKLQNNINFLLLLNKLGLYEMNNYTKGAFAENSLDSLKQKKEYFDYTYAIIKRFNEKVGSDGSKFIFTVMPDDVDYKTPDGWKQSQWLVPLLNFAADNTIEYYNPAPDLALLRQKESQCLRVSQCGGHLNETGHRVLATTLYNYLKENKNVLCHNR